MDTVLRAIAIFLEVVLLAVVAYAVLNGVRLTAFDLGIRPKYRKAIAMVLVVVGVILLVFFVAHLATFYPMI